MIVRCATRLSESEPNIRLHRLLTIALLASIGALLLPGSALADPMVWDGEGDTDYWSNELNWVGNVDISTGDVVEIGSGYQSIVDGTYYVNSLTLTAGAGVTIQGGSELNLRKTPPAPAIDLSMAGSSSLTVEGNGVLGVAGINTALIVFSIDDSGELNLDSTTSIGGTVTLLDIKGVDVHQTASFALPLGSSAIIDQSWKIDSGDTLGGTLQLASEAELSGSGTIGSLIATGATVVTGDRLTADGELTISGTASLTDTVLKSAVDVFNPLVRGHLEVTGAMTLAGSNSLHVASAAASPLVYPVASEIVSAGSITGAAFDASVASPTLVAPVLPMPVASSHQPGVASTTTTVLLDVDGAADPDSGLAGYVVSWDTAATTAPGSSITHASATDITATSPTLAIGSWYAHVVAVDLAGNRSAPRHVGPFVIVAPAPDPVTPTPDTSTPTTSTPGSTGPGAVNPGTPGATAPIAPTRAQVKTVGVLKFATLARRGTVSTTLPVREAGVRVAVRLRLSAKQAKLLKLKLKAGQKSIVIGVGVATSTKVGTLVVKLRLTPGAKAALRGAGLPSSKLRKVVGALEVTLTKAKLSSRVAKPVALVR